MAALLDPRYPRAVISRRILILVLLLLAGCGRYATSYAAVVEGQPISFAELDRQVTSLASSQGVQQVTDEVRTSLRRDALLALIQQAIVRAQVAENKIAVPENEVDARFQSIGARFPDPTQFQSALKAQGYTEETLRDALRDQLGFELLAAKISPVTVTEAQIQKEYAARKTDFEQVHARHILFSTEAQTPAAALAKARDAVKKIRAGTDFATLAKQLSDDSGSKEAGGDLGLRARSFFDGDFARAAFTLPLKKVSDPVQTRFGYHVIEVLERKTTTLAQAHDQIKSEMVQQAQQAGVAEFLKKVIATAEIDVNPKIGDFDRTQLQVVPHQFFSPAPPEGSPTPAAGLPLPQ